MVSSHQLISRSYAAMQSELHARPQGYGGKGDKWMNTVIDLVAKYEAWSVLDYGCGQGSLGRVLRRDGVLSGVRIDEYDPAVKTYSAMPAFADLVICTDVLEHIEPDRLTWVLRHLHLLARKAVFLVVALDEANKVLADGRNAHLILETPGWWETTICEAGFRFDGIDGLRLPAHYNPEKRSKRWIEVAIPC